MVLQRDMHDQVQSQAQRARDADTREIIPKFSGEGTALDQKKRDIVQLELRAELAEAALEVEIRKNLRNDGEAADGADAQLDNDGDDAPPIHNDDDHASPSRSPFFLDCRERSLSPESRLRKMRRTSDTSERPSSRSLGVQPKQYVSGYVKCVSMVSQGVFVDIGQSRDAFLHFSKVCATTINPSDLSNMFAHGDMVEATVERVGSDGKIYLTTRENSRLSAKVCNVIAHIQWQRKFRRVEFQHRQAYERRRW